VPGHQDLSDFSVNGPEFKIVYLPPNTTSLLQPMDRRTMKETAKVIRVSDNVMLRDCWKPKYLLKEISNISAAWSEVAESCMNGFRSKFQPDCIQESPLRQ
jgi:hypothetical protein